MQPKLKSFLKSHLILVFFVLIFAGLGAKFVFLSHAASACDLNATASNFASQISVATAGQTVCLASGDYSSFTGTSKSAPGITITAAAGANVTFNSGITLNLSNVQNFTLDGTAAGGKMTVGGLLDMETNGDAFQDKALNLTFQNIAFTASSNIDLRGEEDSNITFNRDTFVDGNSNCSNGGSASGMSEFMLVGATATPTTQTGVTVENSVWVAPADLWNPYRAIQTTAPMTIESNVFAGFLDHTDTGSCNHVDSIQLFSGLPGTTGSVTFTGNLCYDDYNCIAGFDGTSDNTITDNACFDIEQNCVELDSDAGSVINHNTQQTGGADPSGCATEPATQACTSSGLFLNGHKTGDPATTGEKYTNNIDSSGPNIGDSGSIVTNTNNLWSGASSPNLSGIAAFIGGADPTTWAGFELTPGSAGHAGGSDGLDVGIRASAGGPPTGGGAAPLNTAAPVLSGTAAKGQALYTTDGTWTITGDVPTVTTYQWFDCSTSAFSASCVPIQPQTAPASANDSAYTLQSTDVGNYVFAEVTVTNANGQVSAVSNATGPINSSVITSTDLNSDGTTNIFDLSIFLDHMGQTGTNLPGDFNNDGKVDSADLSILQSHWGGSGSCADTTGHPAGFPGNCNTGYTNAPGYPGQLTSCPTTIQSNTTYEFCNYTDGLVIGNTGSHPTNVTFMGCRFASNSLTDADIADYGTSITFSYDTFEPSAVSAPPVAYNQGYQYGIDQRYNGGGFSVDHSDFWGWGNGIQIGHSSQSNPVSVTYSWFHDARDAGGVDHTDAILENYGDPGYDYMTFSHNTIASVGNSNGLALQDGNGGGYDHITVTDNYFAGFGYTVNLGGSGVMTNTQFTGNVFGSDFSIPFGPLYGAHWTTGSGNTWSGNTYYIFPNKSWLNTAINGLYWWPSDDFGTNNGENPATFAAHTSDYPN